MTVVDRLTKMAHFIPLRCLPIAQLLPILLLTISLDYMAFLIQLFRIEVRNLLLIFGIVFANYLTLSCHSQLQTIRRLMVKRRG